jgi:hypothetical protein
MKDVNRIDTDRDRMPPEVATEMILDPKVKLSGSARRACQRARWTVYPSKRPIVRPMKLDNATGKLTGLPYEYADEPEEPVNHVARKAAQASARQLLLGCVRLKRHRRTAQQRWQKLTEAKERVTDPKAKAAIQKNIDFYDALVKRVIEPKLELFETVLRGRGV